jgi:hypothetical protein
MLNSLYTLYKCFVISLLGPIKAEEYLQLPTPILYRTLGNKVRLTQFRITKYIVEVLMLIQLSSTYIVRLFSVLPTFRRYMHILREDIWEGQVEHMGDTRNICRVLQRKPERKKPFVTEQVGVARFESRSGHRIS